MTAGDSPFLFRSINDSGNVSPVLHEISHDKTLVPLQRQIKLLHFDDGVEQVQELWDILAMLRHETHDFLDLVSHDFHAGVGIACKHLETRTA